MVAKKKTVRKKVPAKRKVAPKKKATPRKKRSTVKKRSVVKKRPAVKKSRAAKKKSVKKKSVRSKVKKSPVDENYHKDGSEALTTSDVLLKPVMGRPTRYSKAMVERIILMISMGYSLNKICSYSDMPAFPTVMTWLNQDEKKDFRDKYTHARTVRTEKLEDEIVDIVDEPFLVPAINKDGVVYMHNKETGDSEPVMVMDNGAIQHARLRADYRHRHLEAMKPKIYGKHAGLGDEIKSGLLARMDVAAGRLQAFEESRTFDNKTGKLVDD